MKRLVIISTLVLTALVLMLPTSALAATGYTFTIVNQHCIPGGYGHNPYIEVKLTAAGQTSLRNAEPAAKKTDDKLMSTLSATERDNFLKLLSRIVVQLQNAEAARAEAPRGRGGASSAK